MGGGADSIVEMSAPSSVYITLPTDGTAFDISAGDFIDVYFTDNASNNTLAIAVREDAQSSWVNQYLFQHLHAAWESRHIVLLGGFTEGKVICSGTMSGISAVLYRYSVGRAKALGLL